MRNKKLEDIKAEEEQTLREIFDLKKAIALDCTTKLGALIPHLEFDSLLDDEAAARGKRPKRPAQLAKALCAALETIEHVKLIMEAEMWR